MDAAGARQRARQAGTGVSGIPGYLRVNSLHLHNSPRHRSQQELQKPFPPNCPPLYLSAGHAGRGGLQNHQRDCPAQVSARFELTGRRHSPSRLPIGGQGKAPGLVLEVASASTEDWEKGPKRDHRRFDETGERHKNRQAGDCLVESRYRHISVEEPMGGVLQRYGAALNPFIRWEQGLLR